MKKMLNKIMNYLHNTTIIQRCLIIIIILEIIFISQFKIVIGFGESMLPTLKDSSPLICHYTKRYNINDVVYFKVGGLPVVHRIIDINDSTLLDGTTIRSYKTKGDNNDIEDFFTIYDENIVCKVVGTK